MAEGPTVVIGADGGIGRAIVALGASRGLRMLPVVQADADLAVPGTAERHLQRLWHTHGPFAGVVHAAGLYPAAQLLAPDPPPFDAVLAVNTRSFLEVSRCAARLARDADTPLAIVALSSTAAQFPRPGTGVYAASKAALNALVRAIALEGAPSGIRCNAVAPGYVAVGSALNPVTPEYEATLRAGAPSGRLAVADDIAPLVLWLLSAEAAWVTGQTVVADGGASLGSVTAPSWLADPAE